ncbi:MAG: alpha-mannosidase [Herbinix sp.]|nr:alpha-mannosidase [Herbinix sp.]
MRRFAYGEEITDQLFAKAFFALCEGQEKAKENEIPVMIFNPHPFELEGDFEIEFMLANQNWNYGDQTVARVYDTEGNFLPTQNEKPECTFNLDWIQKVTFQAKLAPASVSRFDCKLSVVSDYKIENHEEEEDNILCDSQNMIVKISKNTGLIEYYEVDNKALVSQSGKLEVFHDNEDPWGMTVDSFRNKAGEFTLLSDEEANSFLGYPGEKGSNVRVIENGAVRMKVQAIFGYGRSVAVVEYTIPKKNRYIDVNIMLYSNEANKMIKYRLDTCIDHSKAYGQTAFGSEELFQDGREVVFHKWCGLQSEKSQLSIVNDGIYGGSFENNAISLSLLRTPLYSAHPIGDRQLAPHNRFVKHIDMGERIFNFRITPEHNIEREANVYNEKPFALSFFPSGAGEKQKEALRIEHPAVVMTALKKLRDGYIAHLYNSAEQSCEAQMKVLPFGLTQQISFGKYELKFIFIDKNGIRETKGF